MNISTQLLHQTDTLASTNPDPTSILMGWLCFTKKTSMYYVVSCCIIVCRLCVLHDHLVNPPTTNTPSSTITRFKLIKKHVVNYNKIHMPTKDPSTYFLENRFGFINRGKSKHPYFLSFPFLFISFLFVSFLFDSIFFLYIFLLFFFVGDLLR